jgi:hypothetical protein
MSDKFDCVTTKNLIIVDDAERVRARITTCSQGDGRPLIQLMDLAGCPRLELSLQPDGTPHLTLFSESSVVQGSFGLDPASGGVGLTLWSENGCFNKNLGVSNDGFIGDESEYSPDESDKP